MDRNQDNQNSSSLGYTEWQREYFDAMTPDEIDNELLTYAKNHPYDGDPATVI